MTWKKCLPTQGEEGIGRKTDFSPLWSSFSPWNASDFEKYNKEWYRNADDMATFLSKANPNWSMKTLKDMFYVHLQLLTNNVKAKLKKDWEADIHTFDQGENHMIMFADVLSDGIIKQFPKKFK